MLSRLNVYKEKAASKKKIRPKAWKSVKSVLFELNIEKETAASNKEDSTKGLKRKKEKTPAYSTIKTRKCVETLRIAPFAHILTSSCLASKYYKKW